MIIEVLLAFIVSIFELALSLAVVICIGAFFALLMVWPFLLPIDLGLQLLVAFIWFTILLVAYLKE